AAQGLGRDRLLGADLVLWCRPATDADVGRVPDSSVLNRLEIVTKADLMPVAKVFSVSALTGFQIPELKSLLADKASTHGNPLAPSLSRCRHHVAACLDHLRRAHHIALEQEPAELLALELRLALDELGAIMGAVYTDDLLDRIFSRFCIGK